MDHKLPDVIAEELRCRQDDEGLEMAGTYGRSMGRGGADVASSEHLHYEHQHPHEYRHEPTPERGYGKTSAWERRGVDCVRAELVSVPRLWVGIQVAQGLLSCVTFVLVVVLIYLVQ